MSVVEKEIRYEHHFIVNPNAGNGKAIEVCKSLEWQYRLQGIVPIVHVTTSMEEANQKVKFLSASPGEKYVYSIGGDGTLNSVVNGMIKSDRLILRVIPGGTGNDFFKMIDKNSQRTAIDCIKTTIDGKEYYAIGIVSFGLDNEVAQYANGPAKEKHGKLAYYMGVVKAIKENKRLLIEKGIYKKIGENEPTIITQPLTLLAVCNGGYYGSGINIAPQAQINDGKLDILYAGSMNRVKLSCLLGFLMIKKHEGKLGVISEETTGISITAPNTISCCMDGLLFDGKKFEVMIVPNGIIFDNDFIEPVKELVYQKTLVRF